MAVASVVVLMGVSGSGKSTIGNLLAQRTGWPLVDADDLHPAENIAKMRAGIPLADEDRWPWLHLVAERLAGLAKGGRGGIVACSALKRAYRDLLREADPAAQFVYLRTSRAELMQRLAHRIGHFFPTRLLDAQLADLEEPAPDERPIIIPVESSPSDTVAHIMVALGQS